jgi:hypothetical protein
MARNAWPLGKIFWTIFTLEALGVGVTLTLALASFAKRSGPDGGLVGAWIVLIPVGALALVAALFAAAKAPWLRVLCIVLLLWPFVGAVLSAPVHLLKGKLEEYQLESARLGEHLFSEPGQRKLASAIAHHDPAGVKAALAEAGDLNATHRQNLPYYTPLGDAESILSFACQNLDDSESSVEVIRILLRAGANPNLPAGVPLSAAIFRSVAAAEALIRAGADVHAVDGYGQPVWWYALGHEGRNVEMLGMLLRHGASPAQRDRIGETALDHAAGSEWWRSVYFLARHVPRGKDLVLKGESETIQAKLEREIQSLEESNQAVPEDLRASLAAFRAAK